MIHSSGTPTGTYCPHCALELLHGREGYVYCPDHDLCDWGYDYKSTSAPYGGLKPIDEIRALDMRRTSLQERIEFLESQRDSIDERISKAKLKAKVPI